MNRFFISEELSDSWKALLSQTDAQLELKTALWMADDQQHWTTLVANQAQPSLANTEINQSLTQAVYPALDALSLGDEISLLPIWSHERLASMVLLVQHTTALTQDQITQLGSLAGRLAFELSAHTQTLQPSIPTMQEFIDCLDDHVWIKDSQGNYVMVNQSVERAWGYHHDEIIGQDDYQIFERKRAENFVETDQGILASGSQSVVEECSSIDEDGNRIWLETIKSPLHNNRDKLIGILGITRNVTRRKVVETQLSLASQIFNHSHEGMLITDKNAKIIDINQAFTSITGYLPEEVLGKTPSVLQSGHHETQFYEAMWNQLQTTGKWKGEFINRKKDGSFYPQLATISAVADDQSQLVNYICVFEDISVRKAHEEKLQRMAYYDPLTNLPNRSHLHSLLNQQIDIAEKQEEASSFATLFLDIDHFKHINDSMGHFIGDQLLSQLAERLRHVLHLDAHVARIGGDEFVVILPNSEDEAQLIETIEEMLSVFQAPFELGDHEKLQVTTSIGVSLYPKDGLSGETLLKNADTAMYLAKKNGRNGYAFYSPDLTDKSVSHVRIQTALHQAIEKQQLYLVYQPQFNLHSQNMVGVEALLRWEHPDLGLVSPMEFIPIAEKTGLIQAIGCWVLEEACKQGAKWIEQGRQFGRMAVNVSAMQLQQPEFISKLQAVLHKTQFPPELLDIEITESFLLIDQQSASDSLNELQKLGIEISLDDFGTGYSSLSYLQGLPINKLKIDRSFVSDVPNNGDSNAIVNAIIAMGHTLSLKVIAEGVETFEQIDYLSERGCSFGQGYHFSKPVRAEELFKS